MSIELSEKKKQSRRKIVDSALEEFGAVSYIEASMNSICKIGGISKGIIYHYFQDKDQLYLVCLRESVDRLTEYLQQQEYDFMDFEKDLWKYIGIRQQFLLDNPNYRNILLYSMSHPPGHLGKEVRGAMEPFEEHDKLFFMRAMDSLNLKEGVDKVEVIDLFSRIFTSFNSEFKNIEAKNLDVAWFFEQRRAQLGRVIQMLLFGVVKG